eukprot:m.157514 g.157514  ORF g.157514 m.157514 type:complete len:367 (+) comp17971_c0_seq9:186-1286(+)
MLLILRCSQWIFFVLLSACVEIYEICGAPILTPTTKTEPNYQEHAKRLTAQQNVLLNEIRKIKARDAARVTRSRENDSQHAIDVLQRQLDFITGEVKALQLVAQPAVPAVSKPLGSLDSQHSKHPFVINRTYFYIVKSPRSGSTLLMKLLSSDSRVSILWEPKFSLIDPFFRNCKTELCGVSVNDFLKAEQTYKAQVHIMERYNASLIVQLRADVVAKAWSAERMFSKPRGKIKRDKNGWYSGSNYSHITVKNLLAATKGGMETIEGHLIAAQRLPQLHPLFVWYEHLYASCAGEINALYTHLGHPPPDLDRVAATCHDIAKPSLPLDPEVARQLRAQFPYTNPDDVVKTLQTRIRPDTPLKFHLW